jgi:hypothetical protein
MLKECNPSEISAVDFEGGFSRFEISSVSTTIEINRLNFENSLVGLANKRPSAGARKSQVLNPNRLCQAVARGMDRANQV